MAPCRVTAAGLGLEPAAAAARLLDALLAQAAALVAAGGNIGPLAAGLGRRLAAAGVMAPSAQGALAQYSTALLDMLPKAWTDAGGLFVCGRGGGVHACTYVFKVMVLKFGALASCA